MALDKISEELLNGIFYATLKSPDGLSALKYRADNEQSIPELDQLEHLGYVQRYNDLYSIKPLALAYLAGENLDASRIVNMCVLVFALLRGAYKDNPKQSITAPNISKNTGLSEHEVGTVLRVIIQTPILAHHSSHLSGERAHVTPSENILKYSSFEDLLKQMQESAEKKNQVSSSVPRLAENVEGIEPTSNRVFIVHGHDEAMKESVARTLEKIELAPIILHEQPNKGRTVIEKFVDYSDVSFAVVLLSPDDYAHSKDNKTERPRARQNVILELGFFLGRLGRERVLVLFSDEETNFEIPSDYSGVVYTPYDKSGNWRFKLVQELKACGFNVDANVLL